MAEIEKRPVKIVETVLRDQNVHRADAAHY